LRPSYKQVKIKNNINKSNVMKYTKWLAMSGSLVVGVLLLGGVASAQTMPPQGGHGFGMGGRMGYGQGTQAPGVVGKVSAISGTTLTVTSSGFGRGQNATPTTYTVNASTATVMKNGTSSSITAVNVGDMVFVQGTVSGANVTATSIRDGIPTGGGMRGFKNASGTWNGSSTMPRRGTPQNLIQGNGQPVVGGSVAAISGDTLTVATTNNNVTYTIDATNATIEKGGATSTIASIAVGDDILVQGSVSGTSVTATSVIDQGAPRTAPATASPSNGGGRGFIGGVMNSIGGFFHHLFGFF